MTVEMQVRSDTTSGEDSGGQEGIENPDVRMLKEYVDYLKNDFFHI
jgi:hypothetical protein